MIFLDRHAVKSLNKKNLIDITHRDFPEHQHTIEYTQWVDQVAPVTSTGPLSVIFPELTAVPITGLSGLSVCSDIIIIKSNQYPPT